MVWCGRIQLVDAPEMVQIRELDSVLSNVVERTILNQILTKLKLTWHFVSSSSHRKRQFTFPLHSSSAAMQVASSQSYSSGEQAEKWRKKRYVANIKMLLLNKWREIAALLYRIRVSRIPYIFYYPQIMQSIDLTRLHERSILDFNYI